MKRRTRRGLVVTTARAYAPASAHQPSPVAVGLAIVAALAAVGGIAYAASSSSTPATPSTPGTPTTPTTPTTPATPASSSCGVTTPPLGPGQQWVLSDTIAPGQRVRISMEPGTFQTIAATVANLGTGLTGWTNLLSQPQVVQELGTSSICVWAPGDPLPADWPGDDQDVASEYHAEFTYGGTVTLTTSTFPLPVSVWVAKAPVTVKSPSPVQNPGAGGINPGVYQVHPSTAPRTIDLVAPPSGQAEPTPVGIVGVLPGTPITFAIDGGGTFDSISSVITGPNAYSAEENGYPLPPSSMPTLPFWVYTTSAATGQLTIGWTDSSGAQWTTTVTYGP